MDINQIAHDLAVGELLGNKLPEHLKSGEIPPFSGCVHDTNTACLSAIQLLLLFLDFLVRLRH